MRRRSGQAGLTLVELLVVLVILALLSSVVIALIPEGRSEADRHAAAIERALGELSDRAVISAQTTGLSYRDGVWVPQRFVGDEWAALALSDALPAAPPDVAITVETEQTYPYHDQTEERGVLLLRGREVEAAPEPPQIVFSIVGDSTPFTIRLDGGGNEAALLIGPNGTGRMEVRREAR